MWHRDSLQNLRKLAATNLTKTIQMDIHNQAFPSGLVDRKEKTIPAQSQHIYALQISV